MTPLAESLNRTLLLMRDEVGLEVNDSVLLAALTNTRVVLIADDANIVSHAAQTTFATTAMLMARSGHQVFIMAPNVPMQGFQPPLQSGRLVEELLKLGKNMLPGVEFIVGGPEAEVDLAIALGNTPINVPARRRICLNAEAWVGIITPEEHAQIWNSVLWPFGALAAAGLAAGEAFKITMQKLLPYALNAENTAARFAYTNEVRYELAPPDTPFCRNLGAIDFVSGGAITNAVLYCLARIPAVTAHGRIIEPDTADLTNLNRYMLLLQSADGSSKAQDISTMLGNGLDFLPLVQRYEPSQLENIAPLAPVVVVGVDHIPTRWAVQQAMPEWLAIGATTHWSAMASFHSEGLGCAYCLHSKDDPAPGPIPTVAHVSFWAGLLAATYVARHAANDTIADNQQQVYLSPFQAEYPFHARVERRSDCPLCSSRKHVAGTLS